MLRSIFIIAIILFGIVQSFRAPFYALLFYLWIAYFRPETWLWYDFFSTLDLLADRRRARAGGDAGVGPGDPHGNRIDTDDPVSRSVAPLHDAVPGVRLGVALLGGIREVGDHICLLIITHVRDEARLRLIIQVIAFSLGFKAVKQGWAQLVLNPGASNANDHAMLGDNNGVAVGMLMLVSVLLALARTAPGKKERLLEQFCGGRRVPGSLRHLLARDYFIEPPSA